MSEKEIKEEWFKRYESSWWKKLYWKFFKRKLVIVAVDPACKNGDKTVKVYRKDNVIIGVKYE